MMSRVLSVLDTSAGPNLVRKSELPATMETLVSFGPTQDIGDANNRPLRTLGSFKMPMRLGKFMAAAEFIVCEKRAVLLILGADYCDRFVEAISLRRKTVEMADFSEVPILKRISPRKGKKNLVPGEDEDRGKRGANVPQGQGSQGQNHRARDAARCQVFLEEGRLGCDSALSSFIRKAWIDMYE